MTESTGTSADIKDLTRMVFTATSFTIILFVALTILLASITFILNYAITPYHFILSCLFSIGGLAWCAFYYFPERRIPVLAFSMGLIVITGAIAFFISVFFYDISWDGQAYHQEIIIQLANGWNPVYGHDIKILPEYSKHYAIGMEISEAVIYSFTGRIESGKACTIILMAAAALCASSFLLNFKVPAAAQVLLPLIIAFNPVSFNQSLSYYVDGCLGSLITITIILLGSWIAGVKGPVAPFLVCAAAALLNVKFLAVPYAVIVFAGIAGYYLMKRRWPDLFKVVAAGTAAFVIGIGIMGFNPYLTNTFRHGHPFYPYYGGKEKKIDLAGQVPKGYQSRNNLSHLFYSTFSESGHDQERSKLKIPFTVNKNEIKQFFSPAVRVGGFGPLFGGAIVLAFIALGALFAARSRYASPALYAVVIVLASVIINPACWWARFVPQLWMVPCIALFFLQMEKSWIYTALSMLLAIVLITNIALVGYTFLDVNIRCSSVIRKQMEQLKAEHAPVKIYYDKRNTFYSNRIRFMEAGIPVQEQPLGATPPSPSKVPILGSTTVIEVLKQ